MMTKVQKWGNSQGLRLSKQLLLDADISVGDSVDLAVREGVIVITPVKRVRGKCDLKELVKHIRARKAKRIGRAPEQLLAEALSLLDACIY